MNMAENVTPFQLNYRGEPEGELLKVLDQLERLTSRLRVFGWYAASLTGISLVTLLSMGAFGRVLILADLRALTIVGLTLPLMSIACLIVFDSIRKKGDAVFKELSDELQWYVRYGSEERAASSSEPTASIRPDLRTRIVLREYATATVLPLLSAGRNGPAIYAIADAMLALLCLLLSLFAKI